MIRFGYACKVLGVPGTAMRTCTLKHGNLATLLEVSRHNLLAVQRMVEYNQRLSIGLLRISSDVIPLGSHPDIHFDWRSVCAPELAALGRSISASGVRVSMHPGQYTVLNSPHTDVVERSSLDLIFHANFLDALGQDASAKLVLHVGGVYGDRTAALARFACNFSALPDNVRARLVLENDERCFSIADVLELSRSLNIPTVFDVFHHALHQPLGKAQPLDHWLDAAAQTWKTEDGRQKIHYSQQWTGGKPGMHSRTIATDPFWEFYMGIDTRDIDIMLEVKDKNLSAVKCINLCAAHAPRKALTEEWACYKYSVLEHSPAHYQAVREYLKTTQPLASGLYCLLEEALALDVTPGNAVNAAQHVWGYVSEYATPADRKKIAAKLDACASSLAQLASVKRHIYTLAEKNEVSYLLQSLYFCDL